MLTIKNAHIISPRDGLDLISDITIDGGRIKSIGASEAAENVIDASGMCAAPGFVDLFARAAEPEQEGMETLLSLSHAAVRGGFTTVCAHTGCHSVQQLIDIKQRAEYTACDILPAARATDGREMYHHSDFKLYGARALYDDEPIKDPALMRDTLFRARKNNIPLFLREREDALYREGIARAGFWANLMDIPAIPASSETTMLARDLTLAAETGACVHVGHISTAAGVEMIRVAKREGVCVTCSTEPPYFALTSRELFGFNTLAKLDPPIGNPEDREAICRGLEDGTIDCLASGHDPQTDAAKRKALLTAPWGASGIELAFAAALTYLYHGEGMPLSKVVDLFTAAPAAVIGADCGTLKIGAVADITLFDPDHENTVRGRHLLSAGHNTPFEGKTFRGQVLCTLKDGRMVWQTGRRN